MPVAPKSTIQSSALNSSAANLPEKHRNFYLCTVGKKQSAYPDSKTLASRKHITVAKLSFANTGAQTRLLVTSYLNIAGVMLRSKLTTASKLLGFKLVHIPKRTEYTLSVIEPFKFCVTQARNAHLSISHSENF